MTRGCGLTSISLSFSLSLLLLFCVVLTGCLDAADPGVPATLVDRRIAAPRRRAPRARALRPVTPRRATRLGLTITPLTRASAAPLRLEDGTGQRAAARNPVALDVTGDIAPRALDPSLRVGDKVFRDYVYTEAGALRFTAADASDVPPGAEIRLEYGGEAAGLLRSGRTGAAR